MKNPARTIQLPLIRDSRGNLAVVESGIDLPFEIKRVFYIFDVPTGESRGAHAHRSLEQVIVCLSGSFSVLVDDGLNAISFTMNRPWSGLYVPPMLWASEMDFSPGSVCLVFASDFYNESDYIRDYVTFKSLVAN